MIHLLITYNIYYDKNLFHLYVFILKIVRHTEQESLKCKTNLSELFAGQALFINQVIYCSLRSDSDLREDIISYLLCLISLTII